MTGNSMVALMLMLLLCFIGMLVMFLFVIRSNTVLSDTIKEAIRQQRHTLHDIEQQLLELSFTVNKAEVKEVCSQYEEFSPFDGGRGQTSLDDSLGQKRNNIGRQGATDSPLGHGFPTASYAEGGAAPGTADRAELASTPKRDSDLPKLSL